MKHLVFVSALSLLLLGCASASSHRRSVDASNQDKLTVGTVQKQIHKGMAASDVAAALGSPNIVTTDAERREVWIYDKVSTDVTYSQSQGYGTLLIIGGQSQTGASSKTQKTLTVIIKYDDNNLVRDFTYHSSQF